MQVKLKRTCWNNSLKWGSRILFTLEDVEVEQWLDDGVICLRKVFNLKWLKILELGFQQSVETPSALSKDYAGDKKGSFYTDHAMHLYLTHT